MKYDITFMIPFSGYRKYFTRLEYFKKSGLVNPGGKKVALKAIVGDENIPNIENGWPDWLDVEIIKNRRHHVAAKMYEYFAKMSPADLNSRWYTKFDDDTFNDVSGLVDNLDKYFDYQKEYYICADIMPHEHPIETKNAVKNGYKDWFIKGHPPVWHEKEGSIISYAAMDKILSNPGSVALMRDRGLVEDGWGDITFSYAARAAKIYCSDANFVTSKNLVGCHSYFGGCYNHTHFIAPDISSTKHIIDIIQDDVDNVLMNNYQYTVLDKNLEPSGTIIFNSDATITYHDDNFKIWSFKNDQLKIFDEGGRPICFFNVTDIDMLNGRFLRGGNTFILRRINSLSDRIKL